MRRTDLSEQGTTDRWVIAAVVLTVVVLVAAAVAVLWQPVPQPLQEPSFEAEQRLVERFAELKQTNDPAVDELLGPVPVVPEEAVSPGEAARLDAEFYLRQPLEIRTITRDIGSRGTARFLLQTRGAVVSKTLAVQGPTGVDRIQRTAVNPAVIVEVRNGKIHALEARLGN